MRDLSIEKRYAAFIVSAYTAGAIADRLGIGMPYAPAFVFVLGVLIAYPLMLIGSWAEGR